MHRFKKLEIWKESLNFVCKIYKITKNFPKEELYGLTSQLRRASVSINLNIAEGAASKSDIEFRRFLIISLKSTYEVVAILEIILKLNYINSGEFNELMEEVNKVGAKINFLINRLNKSNSK